MFLRSRTTVKKMLMVKTFLPNSFSIMVFPDCTVEEVEAFAENVGLVNKFIHL